MVEISELVNKKVEERFRVVEDKLRNSFGAIKKDNERVISSMDKIVEKIKMFSEKKLEISDFDKNLNEIRQEFKKTNLENRDSFEKTLSEINKRIDSLKKEISEKDIIGELKKDSSKKIEEKFSSILKKQKEELKELQNKNSKKLTKDFEKFKEQTEYLRKEFIMFKNEFVGLRKSIDEWKNDIAEELKDLLKESEGRFIGDIQNLEDKISSLKARNTILTKEINSFKEKDKI